MIAVLAFDWAEFCFSDGLAGEDTSCQACDESVLLLKIGLPINNKKNLTRMLHILLG
jgi:hypothetical protein